MRTLLHTPLSPFGRLVRLALAEKRLEFDLVELPLAAAEARGALDQLGVPGAPGLLEPITPPFDVALEPVLIEDGRAIGGAATICEYLEDSGRVSAAQTRRLLPTEPLERAEARQLIGWVGQGFWREAVAPALHERYFKSVFGAGAPDATALRSAAQTARSLLAQAAALIDARGWLAVESLSLADFALAAQISVLDYLGARPFGEGDDPARDWYALIKSRPSFRDLLADRVPRLPPAADYQELDF